jgi:hypothetical protein
MAVDTSERRIPVAGLYCFRFTKPLMPARNSGTAIQLRSENVEA